MTDRAQSNMQYRRITAQQGTEAISREQTRARWSRGDLGFPPGEPPFLTTGEVAELFRAHPKTVERWRKTDGLPCCRLGRLVRYELSEVLRWASARKEAP